MVLIPHHGLKELQKVMLKSLIFVHPSMLGYRIEENNYRKLVVVFRVSIVVRFLNLMFCRSNRRNILSFADML